MQIGDMIYKLRRQNGWSQEELGFRIGVTRQTISQWEANKLNPKADKLKTLCEVFGVKPDLLLFNDHEDSVATDEIAISNENKDVSENNLDEGEVSIGDDCIAVDSSINHKNKKRLIAIIISSITLVIAIVLLIFFLIMEPKNTGVDSVTSCSFNFTSPVFITIIFILLFAVAISMFFIFRHRKNGKSRKNDKL